MKKIIFSALILVCSCATSDQIKNTDFKFALISSTSPESPFRQPRPELSKLIDAINAESPVFTIHTGNIIMGGDSRTGVTENDITKQFAETMRVFNSLRSVSYFTPGENDAYDSSYSLFCSLTGKKEYFSFNYGSMHVAVINAKNSENSINTDQLKWLKNDLKSNSGSQLIVISSLPSIVPDNAKKERSIANAANLHDKISSLKVRAFISTGTSSFNFSKDGVTYVNLPIADAASKNAKENHFYIIEFKNGELLITGKRIN